MISKTLKTPVGFCGPNLRFEVKNVYARSLRAAGAVDILYSGVDSKIINLIGRWRSNKMLRYLHVQVEPLMRKFSQIMLMHGHYPFLPH